MFGVAWGTFSSCPLLLQDTVWSKRVGRLLMGDLGKGWGHVRGVCTRTPQLPSPHVSSALHRERLHPSQPPSPLLCFRGALRSH